MRVKIYEFTGGHNLPPKTETIKVEKHLNCNCECIVKEKDCNLRQRYVQQQCKCLCTNVDEKEKCLQADPKLKFWDSTSCSCQCLNIKDCTTGYLFNKHTCSCEPEQRQIAGQHNTDVYRR
ncbi:balbiani ring protein 3 [Halyomorpha halys]|uniref:balbiani ring protein 3 n=1 Tax=Halyomorpha halys TaxID=286706 RepID=UPI0034D2E981